MSKHFNPFSGRPQVEATDRVSLGKAKILQTTAKAIRVLLDSDGKTYWVPESCVHDDSEVFRGCDDEGDLVVKTWWAEKEGLA